MKKHRKSDTDTFVKEVFKPEMQRALKIYIDKLHGKKKKKE